MIEPQKQAVDSYSKNIEEKVASNSLGVTGSGKTLIWLM